MRKTQIQLPDEMHRDLKALAARLEMPMAELLRRGAEHVLSVYAPEAPPASEWRLPEPLDLGAPRVPVERWRELAHDVTASRP